MDSVSQIVLGAAVGEAVLGRKLGNRGMFWGAVGGTIPDLDIITKPLMSEVDSLAFHRGASHSIVFSILGGLFFGWLIYRLYQSPYSSHFFKGIQSLFLSCIPVSIIYFILGNDWNPYVITLFALGLASGIYYFIRPMEVMHGPVADNPSMRSWQLMFFLAFFTHILLDSFTMYGTQLFLPFSDYRVAFASISVADPIGYTIPFIICLLVASRFRRDNPRRRFWNWMGIGISCTYLVFTLWHKQRINGVFEKQMAAQGIVYDRYITGPSIFNNFLWSMTAENEDHFVQAQYSVFDKSPINFRTVTKNHEILKDADSDRTIGILRWFSKDYYNVIRRKDGSVQINDLRYGSFRQTGGEDDYVFRFILEEKEDGYEMQQTKGGPDDGEVTDIFKALFQRIKGI